MSDKYLSSYQKHAQLAKQSRLQQILMHAGNASLRLYLAICCHRICSYYVSWECNLRRLSSNKSNSTLVSKNLRSLSLSTFRCTYGNAH